MCRRLKVLALVAAAGFAWLAGTPTASAWCGGWGCATGCYAPAPCAARLYPLQPVYRVEQGPIHNVVVVPYEEPHLRFVYLPPRFVADCACYR